MPGALSCNVPRMFSPLRRDFPYGACALRANHEAGLRNNGRQDVARAPRRTARTRYVVAAATAKKIFRRKSFFC